MKKIFFITDKNTVDICPFPHWILTTYDETCSAIAHKEEEIFTTSIANMSFDLIDKGYEIYICQRNHSLQIKPGMSQIKKDLQKTHNILKLFLGGTFDTYFEQWWDDGSRRYPQGLCEDCFWKFDCMYANDNPDEYVRTCDDEGGISYLNEDEYIEDNNNDDGKSGE